MTDELAPEAPQYLAARLQQAFAEDRRTAELGVRVIVRGDDVYLRGEVACARRKAALTEVACEIAPRLPIHNEVRVVEHGAPAEVEELR